MATTKRQRLYPRVRTQVGTVSLTKQSFKDECNINKIMDRFQRSGAIDHYTTRSHEYGDTSAPDYLEANLIIANANTMFEELPSSIRAKFENDPAKFLEFVQDDKNAQEMVSLGLREGPSTVQTAESDTTRSDPVSTAPKTANKDEPKDDKPKT